MTIWTIGHSTHALPEFLALLQGPGIQVVADIRSRPFSRYNSQFNQRSLRADLLAGGIGYDFLGAELGGRPPEPEFYDRDGHVSYPALAATARFSSGLARLLAGADRRRVAILCSEEDPDRCHRRLLVGRALARRAVSVVHIRGDGRLVPEEALARLPPGMSQGTLFGPVP
jgi:uncharacterized protein (DUF488 family)